MARDVPAYGRRLIPKVLDSLAETDPHRVYAAIPKTLDIRDGYRDVTMKDFARCVHFTARWIEDKFGRSDSFETITYLGLSDLRGPATLLAAVKTGYKLLLPSPRNPPPPNLSLMDQTRSTKLLYAAELDPMVKSLQALAPSISACPVPSFSEMLESDAAPYPYLKSFDEARDDPIVVLHSSASTGSPKPTTCTHDSWAAHDNEHNLPAPDGRGKMDSTVFKLDGEARLYLMLPFFHLGGFVFYMHHAICNTVSLVLGPPHIAPDAVLLKEIAQQQKLRGVMVIPALLEQLLRDSAGVDFIESLEFVACAGAPFPAAVGDRTKDPVYHEFNPNLKHEIQLYDPNVGTFELVIFADASARDAAPLYHNLPGVSPYYTKDLFTRHPEKPDLFRYYGRKDDILVLANGEKVNPISLEQHVQGHPSVKGAMVVGPGRGQSALLVEPEEGFDETGRRDFLKMLWPRIEESNTHIAGQGRVARDKITVSLPDKPFPRTGKGTVIRKLTEELYKNEIERLYSGSLPEDGMVGIDLERSHDADYELTKIVSFLRQVLAASSFVPAETIREDEDFFAHGLDSLQTLEIAANLKRNLGRRVSSSVAWISPRIIFRNPTLLDLSNLLAAFLNEGIAAEGEEASLVDQNLAVGEAVARYTKTLPSKREFGWARPRDETSTVAIVGSTGYLGSFFVATLLRTPGISRIYCLNRSSDAREKQAKALGSLDETLVPLLRKLVYVRIEFGKPRLGLSRDGYGLIADDVDVVVYNSWRLDFGLAIRSFDPFLRAVRDLVDLSVESGRRMRIVLVSSTSSVESLATKATVPEAPVEDALAAMDTGYGQSKLAAERILVAANRRSGIPVSIIRVGQVGGPSRAAAGVWADQPWISAIVRTSKTLGSFPSPVAPIDRVPVDVVANMLRSFSFRPAQEGPQVYNVASERAQPWDLLVDVVRELVGNVEVVPLRRWVDTLRRLPDPSSQDVAELPALKMLDFYETLRNGTESLGYATSHAREVSGIEIPAVDKETLTPWLRDWNL